jgi:hypothetical protein
VTRRTFLAATAAAVTSIGATGIAAARATTVRVRLAPAEGVSGPTPVMFGVPLPPDLLRDASRVAVLDDRGRPLPAWIASLEQWRPPGSTAGRTGGRDGSIRSLGVRLRVDPVDHRALQIRLGEAGHPAPDGAPPDAEDALLAPDGLRGPRVFTLLPAAWLCASGVAGPQVPADPHGRFAGYDAFVERSFPGSLAYLDSSVYHHWLFDRPTCWYTQYARTGGRRFLEAAFHGAHFMRAHMATDPPDAGYFTLKGPDVKYVYPRAMHLHYLLTGDPRAREAGVTMARYCLIHWDPVYRPERYIQPPLGTDPEAGRAFWSPRHEAYGLLGVLHGWELTGEGVYWDRIREYVDALDAHQRQPPDGRPADGSFRQHWALYDPNESLLPGATSAWMTAILMDALFHAWLVTSDARIPPMIVRWCEFLDRKGFVADGSRAYYVIDCFGDASVDEAPDAQVQGMERHSTELAMTFAMGHYFATDPALARRFRRRFDRLLATALTIDANRPERAYNWAFQASSRLAWFMTAPRGNPPFGKFNRDR